MEKKFKIGLIGCGHISDTHIRSWKKAKYGDVYAVFDVYEEAAKKKANKYNIAKVFTSLDDIIQECDALDICTPPHTHFDIVMQIIQAGKHFIVEKPLVTTVEEWEKIKEALKGSPTKMTVLHNLKFSLSAMKAKQMIDSGEIGEIIRMNRYFLTSPEKDRMLVGNSHWSHSLPGGRWYETMPHQLYLTHFFLGNADLANVTILNNETALPGAPAEEVIFTLKTKRALCTYHHSSNCEMNRRYIELIGSKKTLTIDLLSDGLFVDASVDSKKRRVMGITLLDSIKRVGQGVPDRIRYAWKKMNDESAHTRIIWEFDKFLNGEAPSPTPIEEIDFVVNCGEQVGREIDRLLEAKQAAL